jgi:hypothetical protein
MSEEPDGTLSLKPGENLGGRPSLYREDFPEQVERLTELGLPLTQKQLARYFGVTERTIARWKAQKSEFCHAIERGRLLADCRVAEKLFEHATGYEWVEEEAVVCKEVTYGDDGQKLRETERVEVVQVVRKLPPDVRAEQFWLKNRQPQFWSDKLIRPPEEPDPA